LRRKAIKAFAHIIQLQMETALKGIEASSYKVSADSSKKRLTIEDIENMIQGEKEWDICTH
jgi:hypothetical protein